MTGMHKKVGSLWTRWDLHLHAPGTKLSSGYGEPNDEAWDRYLAILEDSDVRVFGITDYFSLDSYRETIRRYSEKYPDGDKIFFPNVELRLTESVSNDARNVHTHILFDNNLTTCPPAKLDQVLADLETHITRGGANLRCSELSTLSDYESATVSIAELQKVLKKVFGTSEPYLVVTAANNDGLRGVNTKSPRSLSISDELDKVSHAFFGSGKNTEHFLAPSRYETDEVAEGKPVFCGSDAHSFDDLDRLSGDEPNFEPTWVKADATFRGLRQTLFEPKGRVHIGEKPTVLVRQNREATRFIDKINIGQKDGYDNENGSWFNEVEIPFNPELTAIIGNKGSGKSAIADIIALLAESRQEEYFSFLTDDSNNRKFRRPGYAENFNGQLIWKSGTQVEKRLSDPIDTSKPEAVKYLPQNYFESLTNEIEVSALRQEIEEVVFSHVPESDRMGKSKFEELEDVKTAQSKSEISTFKTRLREVNLEIIELEEQADPNFKKSLEEKLKAKKEEHRVLENSKPQPVPKPNQETDEQKNVAQQISEATTQLNSLGTEGKLVVDRLTLVKSQLQKAGTLREAVVAIKSNVKAKKEELTVQCKELGLDIDEIVKYQMDLSTVDQKISNLSDEIKMIETDNHVQFGADTDYSDVKSYPDLVAAYKHIEASIKTLKETLSAPQKRYQNYLQAMNEIATKQGEIMGTEQAPKPDTVKFLEQKIGYINDELNPKIAQKIETREGLSKAIFDCKTKVRAFYEGLKSSVETLLTSVSATDFSVTIDASFVPDHGLDNLVLEQINQNVKGPFKGTVDGGRAIQKMITEVEWNKFDSVLSFANLVVEKVKTEPVAPQISDIKRFYDYLFSFEYFDAKYELRLGGKNLNELSPGEKGLLLLVFYLHLDKEKTPLIIDQPEDNLDNDSIFSVLAKCIRQAKKNRQVILVTHNPNLAVGADAEQIIYVKLEKHKNYKFSYECGSIENPAVNDAIVKVLEGSRPAFVQRRLKYQIQ